MSEEERRGSSMAANMKGPDRRRGGPSYSGRSLHGSARRGVSGSLSDLREFLLIGVVVSFRGVLVCLILYDSFRLCGVKVIILITERFSLL